MGNEAPQHEPAKYPPPGRRALQILRATGPHPPAVNRPKMVLLAGLPGAGKSTLARAIRARTPISVLESDAARKLLVARPRYSPSEHGLVFAALHSAARYILLSGGSVVADATNLVEGDRRGFYRVARQAAAPVLTVWVEAPEDVIRQRFSESRRDPYRLSDATIEVFEQMKGNMQLPSGRFMLVDTSIDTQSAVAQILEFLNES